MYGPVCKLGSVPLSDLRQYPRIIDTRDMVAILRSSSRAGKIGAVLNLSRGGMLIAGRELVVGRIAGLELMGPGFRYAGVAQVTHHTGGATGLRILYWKGPVERAVRGLIDDRSHPRRSASKRDRQPASTAAAA